MISKLIDKIQKTNAPIVVGLDPKLDYIEFKPSIMYAERNALEKVEKIILKGEQNNRQPQKIIEYIKKLIEKSKKEDYLWTKISIISSSRVMLSCSRDIGISQL